MRSISEALACILRVPEMVRLGKMESVHASIKAYHIDFTTGRAGAEQAKLATVEGSPLPPCC